MYLNYFGLSEPPFRITPHTDFFFAGANRGATLDALLYAITHDEGIVKVSGEVGSGKTMLCRVLMERLPKNVETIYLANPSLSREEILYSIADELKLALNADRATRLIRELQDKLIERYAAGKRVVVLIDEAHAMPKETLEEIRLLSNLESGRHKLLQIVLFGQPELESQLDSSDMRQLKERITHSFRLEPMVTDDIRSYIDFRMRAAGYKGPDVFSKGAIRLISASSKGLTRRINILADKSLLSAFANNSHAVKSQEAKAAIRDSDFFKAQKAWSRRWIGLGGAVGGLLAGILIASALQFSNPWGASSPANESARSASPPPAPEPSVRSESVSGSPQPDEKATAPAAHALATTGPEKAPAPVAPAKVIAEPAVANAAPSPRPSQSIGDAPMQAADLAARTKTPAGPGPDSPPDLMGPITRDRFKFTQQWLDQAPDNHHSIQLMTASALQLQKLERFLKSATKALPQDKLYVYSVKIDGQQHFRVAYGDFPDQQKAREALRELPTLLNSPNPYLRTFARMKSQNRQ
jgi:MSHA biogenesis protein MshM